MCVRNVRQKQICKKLVGDSGEYPKSRKAGFGARAIQKGDLEGLAPRPEESTSGLCWACEELGRAWDRASRPRGIQEAAQSGTLLPSESWFVLRLPAPDLAAPQV